MRSIQILFSADSFIDGLAEELLNEPSIYVPQLSSQFANITDSYRRNAYEYDKPFQTAINNIKLKIPGIRQTLEKQRDVLGREVPNSQKNIFNAFFNPGNTYTDTSNSVSNEVYNLYKQTGEASVIPRKAPNYIIAKGNKVVYTLERSAKYQKVMGSTALEILDEAFNEKEYEKLSDAQKVKFVKSVYDYSAAKAKSQFVYDYKILNAINEGVLTQKQYDKLNDKAKMYLAEEYFMDDYKYKNGTNKIKGSAADYFLEKVK